MIQSIKLKELEVDTKLKEIYLKKQELDTTISSKIVSASGELDDNLKEVTQVIKEIKGQRDKLQLDLKNLSNNSLLDPTKMESEKDKIVNEATENILFHLNKLLRTEEKCNLKSGDILKALDDMKQEVSKINKGNKFLGDDF